MATFTIFFENGTREVINSPHNNAFDALKDAGYSALEIAMLVDFFEDGDVDLWVWDSVRKEWKPKSIFN